MLKLILEAAACRVPADWFSLSPCAISVANADGVEIAAHDGAKWAWREVEMRPELALFAFYVTFRAGANFTTVVVDAAG